MPNLGFAIRTDEIAAGTNPADWDTDGDGMPDGWEVDNACAGIAPLDGDSLLDGDSDGLSNLAEYNVDSDPCDQDSDNDGLDDGPEVRPLCRPAASDGGATPGCDCPAA